MMAEASNERGEQEKRNEERIPGGVSRGMAIKELREDRSQESEDRIKIGTIEIEIGIGIERTYNEKNRFRSRRNSKIRYSADYLSSDS